MGVDEHTEILFLKDKKSAHPKYDKKILSLLPLNHK